MIFKCKLTHSIVGSVFVGLIFSTSLNFLYAFLNNAVRGHFVFAHSLTQFSLSIYFQTILIRFVVFHGSLQVVHAVLVKR